MSQRPRIVVVGSSNTDFVVQVPHLPAVGQTVTDGRFSQVFGGKGANQAVAAARCGGAVTFVACVGDDAFGRQMRANFEVDGIDTSHLVVSPDQPSGAAAILFDAQGRNCIAVAPGANFALTPAHVDAAAGAIRAAAGVVLQMEVPAEASRRALQLAADAGVPVLLNYAPADAAVLELSSAVATLVVNENEAAELLGVPAVPGVSAETAARAAADLAARGPGMVVVTLGGAGCVAHGGGRTWTLPAPKVDVVDTTAAGDTFCGALAVALAEGREVEDALRFATCAGSLATTKSGAQPSIPVRAAVDALAARG